jgi:hypothetical protein
MVRYIDRLNVSHVSVRNFTTDSRRQRQAVVPAGGW